MTVISLSLDFRVHSISLLPLKGFSLNFGQILSAPYPFPLKDGVQNSWLSHADSRSRSQMTVIGLSLDVRVHSISLLPLKGFSLNFGQILASVRWCAELITQPCLPQRLRSQLKVTSLTMTLPCRLKIRFTVKGHGIEPGILCPHPYLFYPWKDFHYTLVKCLP